MEKFKKFIWNYLIINGIFTLAICIFRELFALTFEEVLVYSKSGAVCSLIISVILTFSPKNKNYEKRS